MLLDVLDCFSSYQALYDDLRGLERHIHPGQPAEVVSLAFAIEHPVDPLALLQSWVDPLDCHLYFERSGAKTSILAVGEALRLAVEGERRFVQARDWVKQVTARVTVRGDRSVPFSGAHFFCGFSFFDLATLEDGFAAGSVFLPEWQIGRSGDRTSLVVNRVLDAEFCAETEAREIWTQLQRIQSIPFDRHSLTPSPTQSFQAFTSPDQFKTSVNQALAVIKSKKIEKVVLALAYEVKAAQEFNVVTSLYNLRRLYKDCYIFSCNNPSGETFLGASPERLVTVDRNQLETDALAGSAPRGKTQLDDRNIAKTLLGSIKEIHEHQLVIDFITSQLVALGLEPIMFPATLLQLPNIQHLHTPIRSIVPKTVHILDVVAALHPTPAVAGVPRDLACDQIQSLETFDRSRYAAPIGWIDGEGNGEFAVGIRSAILAGDRARLFAGAGIVQGSNAEHELAEVQLKLQALLRAIV